MREQKVAWLLAPLVFALGCEAPHRRTAPSTAADAPVAVEDVFVRSTVGTSVRGAPIELYDLPGDGAPLLIFAGIHGDEPESIALARRLIDLLSQQPELASGRGVAIAPLINPDGYADGTRHNANGVDCNRNFPAGNWAENNPHGGSAPLSEPETQVVVDLVNQLRPWAVISIHSISGGRKCNNYDGPAQALAELLSQHNGYPPLASIGYPTPGSFGTWAGVERRIPIITLELNRGVDEATAWAENRNALLAAINAQP